MDGNAVVVGGRERAFESRLPLRQGLGFRV